MTAKTPSTRPKEARPEWEKRAAKVHAGPLPEAYIVAWPGYYLNSMGKPGENDRGINDDAFAVIGPDFFSTFNGNADPSIERPEIATLKPGQVVYFKPGRHAIGRNTEHDALRQDSPVIVRRDKLVKPVGYVHKTRGVSLGGGLWTDKDYWTYFWTNLHRQTGGTSSEGCLTIPAAQWDAFLLAVKEVMKRARLKRIACVILDLPS